MTGAHAMELEGTPGEAPSVVGGTGCGATVLHVLPQLSAGGASRVVTTMMREQVRRGMKVSLCVLGSRNECPAFLRGLPQPEFLHHTGRTSDVLGTLRCRQALRRVVDRLQPSVVHAHLWPAVRMVASTLRRSAVPLVGHIHDTRAWAMSTRVRDRVQRWRTRASLGGSHMRLVAVSGDARAYSLQHMPWLPQPIEVVPNGIDVAEFPAMERSDGGQPVRIGAAGRLAPEKGFDHLLDAAAELQRDGISFELAVAGEGGCKAGLQARADRTGLGAHVRWRGDVRDMPAFYGACDVFVLASTGAEGMPMVLLEAMACGTPVIATDVAGVREVVRDGVDGRVVRAGDAHELAGALAQLARDGDARRAMGKAAAARVRTQFTAERMVDRLGEVYSATIAGTAATSAVTAR